MSIFSAICIFTSHLLRIFIYFYTDANFLLSYTFIIYSLATPLFLAASATALATAGPTLSSKASGII